MTHEQFKNRLKAIENGERPSRGSLSSLIEGIHEMCEKQMAERNWETNDYLASFATYQKDLILALAAQ